MKNMMLTTTMLAPVGVAKAYEITRPDSRQMTEITAAHITTFLNLLHILMAERAGKTMRADISRVPIILIPSTIVMAVDIAIKKL